MHVVVGVFFLFFVCLIDFGRVVEAIDWRARAAERTLLGPRNSTEKLQTLDLTGVVRGHALFELEMEKIKAN